MNIIIFLAEFENTKADLIFTRYITVPDGDNYDNEWRRAINLALEFENTNEAFLLRKLSYEGISFVNTRS